MEKQNIKNWEEEYWDLWQKEDDLTHISQDILVFIRKLLAQKEKEVREKSYREGYQDAMDSAQNLHSE